MLSKVKHMIQTNSEVMPMIKSQRPKKESNDPADRYDASGKGHPEGMTKLTSDCAKAL